MKYFELLPKVDYSDSGVRNIFKKYILASDLDPVYLQKYTVKEGETLEKISYNLYDSTDYWWLLAIINDFKDIIFDMPMSNDMLTQIAKTESEAYPEEERVAKFVEIYELLQTENDSKRDIQVVNPRFMSQILTKVMEGIKEEKTEAIQLANKKKIIATLEELTNYYDKATADRKISESEQATLAYLISANSVQFSTAISGYDSSVPGYDTLVQAWNDLSVAWVNLNSDWDNEYKQNVFGTALDSYSESYTAFQDSVANYNIDVVKTDILTGSNGAIIDLTAHSIGETPFQEYVFTSSGITVWSGLDIDKTDLITNEPDLAVDDLYIATDTLKQYRYDVSETWIEVLNADYAQTLADVDGKRTIFSSQPTSYKVNDLLIPSADFIADSVTFKADEIYIARNSNTSWVTGHWEKATVYTDDTALTDFIAGIYSDDIQQLQNQIDGSITTWFYPYVPNLTNEPALSWTTDEVKNAHLGDLFYDETTGYAYRFTFAASVYSWNRITDTDVTTALANAAAAQDTADSKRRIFVVQPTPPYDVGDLWTEGPTGDLRKCTTAKTEGQSYSVSDWELASKYTDDTAADNIVDGTTDLSNASVGGVTLSEVQTNATNAITIVNSMSADGVLSPIEKSTWRLDWPNMQAQYDLLIARGVNLGIVSGAEYDEFVLQRTNLYNYLVAAGVWSSPDTNYTITGTEFQDVVADYLASYEVFFKLLVHGTIDDNNNLVIDALTRMATYDTFITNYNNRNDLNGTTPADPIIFTDGTGTTHEPDATGRCNIFLKWQYSGTGDAYDIDGFIVTAYKIADDSVPYTFGTYPEKESNYYFDSSRREFAILNMASLNYYVFGIQAYRMVDGSVDPSKILKSNIIKFYTPTNDVYFTDITVPLPTNVAMSIL